MKHTIKEQIQFQLSNTYGINTKPNGDEIEYLIDAQNRGIGKILNDVVVKKWIYQGQLNPIAELDGNDNLLSRFVYGSKAHVPDYVVKEEIKRNIFHISIIFYGAKNGASKFYTSNRIFY